MTADEYIANARALATIKKIAYTIRRGEVACPFETPRHVGRSAVDGIMGARAMAHLYRDGLIDAALERHMGAITKAACAARSVRIAIDAIDHYVNEQIGAAPPDFSPADFQKICLALASQPDKPS